MPYTSWLAFLQAKGCLTTLDIKFTTIPEIPLHLHYPNKQELGKTEGRPAIHVSSECAFNYSVTWGSNNTTWETEGWVSTLGVKANAVTGTVGKYYWL